MWHPLYIWGDRATVKMYGKGRSWSAAELFNTLQSSPEAREQDLHWAVDLQEPLLVDNEEEFPSPAYGPPTTVVTLACYSPSPDTPTTTPTSPTLREEVVDDWSKANIYIPPDSALGSAAAAVECTEEAEGLLKPDMLQSIKLTLVEIFKILITAHVQSLYRVGAKEEPSKHSFSNPLPKWYFNVHFHMLVEKLWVLEFIPTVLEILKLEGVDPHPNCVPSL